MISPLARRVYLAALGRGSEISPLYRRPTVRLCQFQHVASDMAHCVPVSGDIRPPSVETSHPEQGGRTQSLFRKESSNVEGSISRDWEGPAPTNPADSAEVMSRSDAPTSLRTKGVPIGPAASACEDMGRAMPPVILGAASLYRRPAQGQSYTATETTYLLWSLEVPILGKRANGA